MDDINVVYSRLFFCPNCGRELLIRISNENRSCVLHGEFQIWVVKADLDSGPAKPQILWVKG